MTLHVDPIEALWFVVNATTLLLTVLALFEARRDLGIARVDDSSSHEARELTARGNVRREFLRVVVQALLISLVVPQLFSDRPVTLSPFVVALILVAMVLLTSTIFDRRDRDALGDMLLDLVKSERATLALEASVQENIELTREAGAQAKKAYTEANSVNEKIEALGIIVTHKEDKPVGEGEA